MFLVPRRSSSPAVSTNRPLDSPSPLLITPTSLQCKSNGARADGTPYANYYIFIFHLTKDGKINYVNEMLDSAYVG
jgi:hypothetical protein